MIVSPFCLQLNMKCVWFLSIQPRPLPAPTVVRQHSGNISNILRARKFCWSSQQSHTRHTDRDSQHSTDIRLTQLQIPLTKSGQTHNSYDTHTYIISQTLLVHTDTYSTHRHPQRHIHNSTDSYHSQRQKHQAYISTDTVANRFTRQTSGRYRLRLIQHTDGRYWEHEEENSNLDLFLFKYLQGEGTDALMVTQT